jgi:DNA-binding transcriptional LysR family regulator
MNARQLEVFRAIMRNRTLTAAAAALNVSQPAVSKLLRHLENQLGYKLFERISGRLVPTAEAQLLFKDADRIFREIEVLKQFSNRVRDRQIGLLRVAASAPASFSILPAAIQRFARRNPTVRLVVHTLPAEEIAERIVIGDIDLALTMTAVPEPSIHNEVLGSTSIVCVMHRNSPLAQLAEVTPELLRDQVLISYGSAPPPGKLLDEVFEKLGMRREPQIQISMSITAAPLIQRNLGVALVDGLVPWANFEDLVVRPFKPQAKLPIVLLSSGAWAPSRFTKEFGRDIRASLSDLSAKSG